MITKMCKQIRLESVFTFIYLYYVNSILKEEEHESM
jgi:hypothetical protein